MRFLPQTKADWGRFALFPLKAFVVLAWPILRIHAASVGRHFDSGVAYTVMHLYAICFLVLLIGGVVQYSRGLRRESVITFVLALLALLVALPFRIL